MIDAYKEIYNCLAGNELETEHEVITRRGELTILFNDKSSIIVDKKFYKFTVVNERRRKIWSMHSNTVLKINEGKR